MPTKHYDEDKGAWRVEFGLPAEAAAEKAWVCGEFNDWSKDATPMAKGADGRLTVSVWLDPGEYRFRYYLGGNDWENDWAADDYVPNEHGGTDSLVVVPEPPEASARDLAVDEGSAGSPRGERPGAAQVVEPPSAPHPGRRQLSSTPAADKQSR